MKRTLELKVVVTYPKGWTQPEIRDFLVEAVREHAHQQLNDDIVRLKQAGAPPSKEDYPIVTSVSTRKMVTDYA